MSKNQRGRAVPPPAASKIVSIDEATQILLDQPGLYILEYKHAAGCITPRTQLQHDCTCPPDKLELILSRVTE